MCLNETHSRVSVGKHTSYLIPFKSGMKQDALSPLLFNIALENVISRAQVNQDGLKLNDMYQLLVYPTDINVWGKIIHTINQNRSLVVSTKKTELKVNAD